MVRVDDFARVLAQPIDDRRTDGVPGILRVRARLPVHRRHRVDLGQLEREALDRQCRPQIERERVGAFAIAHAGRLAQAPRRIDEAIADVALHRCQLGGDGVSHVRRR